MLLQARVGALAVLGGGSSVGGHGEVEEPGRLAESEGGQDGLVPAGESGALRDLTVGGREGGGCPEFRGTSVAAR